MSWQDTLRDLDDRLATGDLDAGRHRKLRDDALAEAAGPTRQIAGDSPVFSPRVVEDEPRSLHDPERARYVDGEALFAVDPPYPLFHKLVAMGLVAALGAGAWWLLSPSEPEAQAAPPAPQVVESPAEQLARTLPALPGTVVSRPAVIPASLGSQLGIVPANTSGTLVNASSSHGTRTVTFNALDTDHVEDALRQATSTGWAAAPEAVERKDVRVVGSVQGATQNFRAVYRSGRWTVVLTASGAGADAALRPYFDSLLARTLLTLPAG
ncbi:hypothetical protein V5P93_000061 [Actinokineospora auranticolor]|uniref:Uncharacterized protein n=1 Tax=Actinokineospora auranticolor TaxID=155976 RepID=A0A2S6GSK4_9PSEU|nr:hypothetical protein [Actinokineospora auranticolor]PPK68157.1 hypothetical protein CLV40_106394 [Actinokineospora auranticolor]